MLENLKYRTKYTFSSYSEVQAAFRYGLFYTSFPDAVRNDMTPTYMEDAQSEHFRFEIYSQTADAWHPLYRELREKGWERVSAAREGGTITYIMQITRAYAPEAYQTIQLKLTITLATCKQVKIGTKEIDVYETRCDDLEEPEEEPDYDINKDEMVYDDPAPTIELSTDSTLDIPQSEIDDYFKTVKLETIEEMPKVPLCTCTEAPHMICQVHG